MLAVLTYRFVERPIHDWRRSRRLRNVPVLASMLAACLLIGSVKYAWSLYVAPRLLPAVTGLEPPAVGAASYPPTAHRGLLLGDSHATVLASGAEDYVRRAGASWTVTARGYCPPLLHIDIVDPSGERNETCNKLFGSVDFSDSEFLVVTARWNLYLGLPWSELYYRQYGLTDEQAGAIPADPIELMRRGLAATLAAAKQGGVRRILVVGPLPEFPLHPPSCLVRALRLGVDDCMVDRASVDARRARTMEMLRRVTQGIEGTRLIDPIDVFCDATTCWPHSGRMLYFFDSNHLSPAGIERFLHAFESDFRWALTGEQADARARPPP